MHNIKKRGKMSLEVIIMIVLLLFFLGWVVFFMIRPLYSIDFQSGVKGRLCQTTLNLARNTPIIKIFPVICSTDRIKDFNKDFISKVKKSDESLKDAEIRFIYDKMLQCKNYIGGETRFKLVNEISCYICFSLETDEDIPAISYDEFQVYALSKKAPTGVSYLTEFQKENHLFIISLLNPESVFVGDEKEGVFSPGRDYGIVYIDRANTEQLQKILVPSAAGAIGYLVRGPWGIVFGLGAGGVYDIVTEFGQDNSGIMLTDLEIVENKCRGVLTKDAIIS